MRRRAIIIGVCAILVGLIFFATLALRGRKPMRGAASNDANHESHLVGFGLIREVVGYPTVFTASLTNRYSVPIYLRGHVIQYEDERGQFMNFPRGWSTEHPWVGITNFDTLLPDAVATISFRDRDIPEQAKRIRLVFQYFYDAGPAIRAASSVVTNLPVGKLSPETRYRLYQQGVLTGQHQRSYDGEWVSISR